MSSVIGVCAEVSSAEGLALSGAIDTLNRLMASEAAGAPQIEWRGRTMQQTGGDEHIYVLSLLIELDHVRRDWSEHERAVRDKIGALVKTAAAPIFILTIFRHVPFDGNAAGAALRLRLRRLNLLAIELSHEMGVTIIDIDRALADVGAAMAQSDYRLGGLRAGALAGFAMAEVLLIDALPDHLAALCIDRIARHLEAERPVFGDGNDWPEVVRSSWLSSRPRRGFSHAATVYDDFDPNFVALQLKHLLRGKVTVLSAVKAVQVSVGRHGVRATAQRLWNGAAQLRLSSHH